jgi:hypothetical protein
MCDVISCELMENKCRISDMDVQVFEKGRQQCVSMCNMVVPIKIGVEVNRSTTE